VWLESALTEPTAGFFCKNYGKMYRPTANKALDLNLKT
jgi:hypothetical protein